MRLLGIFLIFLLTVAAWPAPKTVKVFVALCDNKTQGIIPVGAKIGNGDDADANLYWGCSDGFGAYFKKSRQWKVIEAKSEVSATILRQMRLQHVNGEVELTAEAYRGSEIRQCIRDFEAAAAGKQYDLVAFIGHNGLMDFALDPPAAVAGNDTQVIVLCCLSERYFGERLSALGCRPLLTTQQLMYPGAFILHEALESWRTGGSAAAIRTAAGQAYAKNQKISVKAAAGVFALREK